jgi:hypothetical protein
LGSPRKTWTPYPITIGVLFLLFIETVLAVDLGRCLLYADRQ